MTRQQYDEIWLDAGLLRAALAECARSAPELFPAGFHRGYRLHGFGRPSRKLPGLKLRKIVTADGSSYWLRPSFIAVGPSRSWPIPCSWPRTASRPGS